MRYRVKVQKYSKGGNCLYCSMNIAIVKIAPCMNFVAG